MADPAFVSEQRPLDVLESFLNFLNMILSFSRKPKFINEGVLVLFVVESHVVLFKQHAELEAAN